MRIGVISAFAVAVQAGASPALAQDDGAKAGEASFKRQCIGCHAVEAGKNKVGPSVFGVVGRKAATAEGFSYSTALKDKGVTWTDDTLDKYLNDPKGFAPGNKMAFAGVKKADERKQIIAYLKTLH
ncbi:MAG TPA: cytochrome c family protein [Reyranella sp.]|jgi:cytochrome c|nr:cytochrome c family protein [Reyranella sp.]